ncbi:carbohydrate ABC transporter permease [Micromonospora sp. NBC_01412]|uniref:carbohydrate ABC transporter permease n=1 Tax=Micromonospora sp. NBC_01412 TaxID=2903590 RepID=UPI003249D9A4
MRGVNRPRLSHLAMFVVPALVVYTVFAVYPLLDSIRLSFFTSEGGELRYVGWDNYAHVLTDEYFAPRFWNALLNNFIFFGIHILVQNPIGLLLAALLTSGAVRRTRGLYRTLIFIPTTLSVVIVGFIWELILSPLWGLVDKPLLGLPSTALPTVSLMSVWQYVGIPMTFLYAVLIAIPNDVLEAARIDGASAWQTFWRIKFPLVLPMFGLITVITYIANFNAFDLIYSVQGAIAGPDFSTDIFGTLFYRTFFGEGSTPGDSTLGAAVATLTFCVILLGAGAYYFLLHRRTTTYEL